MKCMKRNGRCFYFAVFKEKIPVKDEDGNDTGEYYSSLIRRKGNVKIN